MTERAVLHDVERTEAIIVLAKEPAPGRAKTRLQAAFSPAEAAQLAGASIRDTLRAVNSIPGARKFLCWQGFGGEPADVCGPLVEEFAVLPQDPGDLGDRLAGAFRTCWSGDDPAPRTLLVGMDTPQLMAADLGVDWTDADAVLGLAPDGGFWAIGLRGGDPAAVFDGVPMSTDRTGSAQLARLQDLGLKVALLPPVADVDTPADADRVAQRHPQLEFSAVHRNLVRTPTASTMFDRIYDGEPVTPAGEHDPLVFAPERWRGPADDVDAMVAARCRGPVLDLGCGPGRLVQALIDRGVPALGVDLSEIAVRSGRDRGAVTLQRDVHERLPLEGRWATVLLMDSNIGLGADVPGLLERARQLAAPGGLIICEVDPDPACSETATVTLTGTDGRSACLDWSRVGVEAVMAAARQVDLLVAEQWCAGGRVFLGLARP